MSCIDSIIQQTYIKKIGNPISRYIFFACLAAFRCVVQGFIGKRSGSTTSDLFGVIVSQMVAMTPNQFPFLGVWVSPGHGAEVAQGVVYVGSRLIVGNQVGSLPYEGFGSDIMMEYTTFDVYGNWTGAVRTSSDGQYSVFREITCFEE